MTRCAFCDEKANADAYMAITANDGRDYGGKLPVCNEHRTIIALEAGKEENKA